MDERTRLWSFLENTSVLNQKIELGYLKSIEILKVFAYEEEDVLEDEYVIEEEEDIF